MKKEIPSIKGNNIFIRGVNENDLDIIMEWRNKQEIMKCFFNRNKLTSEGQINWYSKYVNDVTDHMFMIITNDNIPIGTMALYHIDDTTSKAEYGRALIAAEGFQGKGFAKEALNLILRYAFDTLKLNRVFLEVFSDNTQAIKLYERCGFITEGLQREHFYDGSQFRDVLVMGILKREYEYL